MIRSSLVFLLSVAIATVGFADSFGPPRELRVPARFGDSCDVRIVGDHPGAEIALLGPSGLWASSFKPSSEPSVRLLAPAGRSTAGPWAAFAAAVDMKTIAIAAPAFEIVVNHAMRESVQIAIEGVFDIDVREGALAVFGVERVENTMAPDGAIAFVVAPGSSELRPVLFAGSGPGAPATVGCHLARSGALRFAPDGGLLIAPGTEPGVHLLDADFQPKRVWSGELLPVGPRCPRTDEERAEYGMSPRLRNEIFNSVPVIEEVFFAAGDPWVVVRRSVDGGVEWHAVRLLPDGALEKVELGLPKGSEFARLRADASGDRLVVLTWENDPDVGFRGARLFELRLGRAAVANE